MNWDVLLPVLQIVVPLLVAGMGYEMGHNPPKTPLARNLYRASFVILLGLVTGISYWQAQRAVQAAKRSERDVGYVKGQLTDMGKVLVSVVKEMEIRRDQPLVASAIAPRKPLVESTAKELGPVPPPPPPIPTQAMLAKASNPKPNRCDVNGDGKVDVGDVQEEINQVLGTTPKTPAGDVDGDGIYSIVDVQRVINASLGGVCRQ